MLAGIAWYWRNCRRYPHTGILLAVVPLFFAWRSSWWYFFGSDIILLAVIIIEDYGGDAPGKNRRLKPQFSSVLRAMDQMLSSSTGRSGEMRRNHACQAL